MRSIVLGIMVVLSLVGSTTTIANAAPGAGTSDAFGDNDGSEQSDPGDPGLPPDQ